METHKSKWVGTQNGIVFGAKIFPFRFKLVNSKVCNCVKDLTRVDFSNFESNPGLQFIGEGETL